jgi:hypothetical protein
MNSTKSILDGNLVNSIAREILIFAFPVSSSFLRKPDENLKDF